jgi:hypothetical protein
MNEKQFILTSGYKYITIRNGKCVEIANKNKATPLTYEKAYGILNTNINKKKRKFYTIEKLENIICDNEEHVILVKETDMSSLSTEVQYWYDRICEIDTLKTDAEKRKEELSRLHSDIEKKKRDLEHKIELGGRFNACLGYKYAKELQEILLIRREIKDELSVLGNILSAKIEGDMHQVKKSIEGLATRKYEPRILNN